jgi:hypothetical protein
MSDEYVGRAPAFSAGESGDNGPSGQETMGARYGIGVMSVHGGARGAHEPQTVPYLMPKVTMRNGGTERVADAIGLTPLGGLMPGPNAIAPAVVVGEGTTFDSHDPEDNSQFKSGARDAWPEGFPVPLR